MSMSIQVDCDCCNNGIEDGDRLYCSDCFANKNAKNLQDLKDMRTKLSQLISEIEG